MRLPRSAISVAGLALTFLSGPGALANDVDVRGTLRLETLVFAENPIDPRQTADPSHVELDLAGSWQARGPVSFSFDATLGTGPATYSRVNRLVLVSEAEPLRLAAGYETFAWSRSEFARLSSVINPTDYRYDPTSETTLGRLMTSAELSVGPALVTAIWLPKAGEARYPGTEDRLRTVLPVVGAPIFERSPQQDSFAFRIESSIGAADIGAYSHIGHSREAALVPVSGGLAPRYPWVSQVGADAQLTLGPAIVKLETRHTDGQLSRDGSQGSGWAASVGGEYAFYGPFGTEADLTAFAEYAWDSRGRLAWSPNQNDLYLGLRLALNNIAGTEVTLGMHQDFDYATRAAIAQLDHRLADGLVLRAEALRWIDDDPSDVVFGLGQDSYLRVSLEFSF